MNRFAHTRTAAALATVTVLVIAANTTVSTSAPQGAATVA